MMVFAMHQHELATGKDIYICHSHLVKNPPAMWETWVRSLGWEDLLEKRKATHFHILAWRIPWTV